MALVAAATVAVVVVVVVAAAVVVVAVAAIVADAGLKMVLTAFDHYFRANKISVLKKYLNLCFYYDGAKITRIAFKMREMIPGSAIKSCIHFRNDQILRCLKLGPDPTKLF